MGPHVSVIVPIYNVEAYIHQCIKSILSQSYHDFELILVDDGSPDHCGEICDHYARMDNRIRVIHKKMGACQMHEMEKLILHVEIFLPLLTAMIAFQMIILNCW